MKIMKKLEDEKIKMKLLTKVEKILDSYDVTVKIPKKHSNIYEHDVAQILSLFSKSCRSRKHKNALGQL